MTELKILPRQSLGYGFIRPPYLPADEDEYYLRNRQAGKPADHWRNLRDDELKELIANGNVSENWNDVLVAEGFDPRQVRGCQFSGLVRIGRIGDVCLSMHDLVVPAGLLNSHLVACDIGDDVAVRNVRYLVRYIVGDRSMLLNLGDMHTTDCAKFGNGIVKDGEEEKDRIALELVNEAGGREVLPFDGMIPADAYLWAKYRQDDALMKRFQAITQAQFDSRRGYYGTVGKECVIKNCGSIKDVRIGDCAYINGANKLKNLTIDSTESEPTRIGEGVELVNGIVGLNCRIFYGCKAVRFVLGNNATLKYGVRLIHSILGDNSTVACGEILHSLIFPGHEQHHNNSFLTAALLKGQSNLAAGATVGSNHNSRANDGELEAGRGFWPGLCTSLKHSSRFASFTLLAKGDYPAELNIPLPFCLINDDRANDRLIVMPAYWWTYNRYALARNPWKYQTRDQRITRTQKIEFEPLAPDTVEEIFLALRLLERWTAKAYLRAEGQSTENRTDGELETLGRERLTSNEDRTAGLETLGENMECSRRKVVIVKPRQGYRAYREMLLYYAVKNLLDYLETRPQAGLSAMAEELSGPRQREWVNVGGQLISSTDIEKLFDRIKSGELDDWNAIHTAYEELWQAYPLMKQRHAFGTLLALSAAEKLTPSLWEKAIDEAARLADSHGEQIVASRKKDYENPFRRATFADAEEMRAVLGDLENNSFLQQTRADTEALRQRLEAAKQRK